MLQIQDKYKIYPPPILTFFVCLWFSWAWYNDIVAID